jgi:homoserine O-acetyltransferase
VAAIASTVAASALQISLSSVQRSSIALDPKWRGGDYYDAEPGDGPHFGLALARQAAQISYRTEQAFNHRFGRKELDLFDDRFTLWQRFDVEGYLDYQGAKLVRRFDANSYLVINRAMDLHDLGRGRGGMERALSRIAAPVLTMSIDSDVLYPAYQQELIDQTLRSIGSDATHVTISSPDGHDAFLIETDAVGAALVPFLTKIEKGDR